LRRVAGEINTLQGNLNWVASREHSLNHPVWGGREHEFLPLTSAKQVGSCHRADPWHTHRLRKIAPHPP